MPAALTSSQVKKSGRTLRLYLTGRAADMRDFNDAYEVLVAYRASHAYPLVTANNGLRSMIRTEHFQVEVSQRLKRVPTIMEKLVREPTLPLSSMQDIGGCRAILNSVDEVRRVEQRIRRNHPPVGTAHRSDTRTTSQPHGVRAIAGCTSSWIMRDAGSRSSCAPG